MKKATVLVFACLVSVFAKAQTKENVTKVDEIITISEVVTVENMTANEIYNSVLLWVNSAYNSPKTVIQNQDKEIGLVTIKAIKQESKSLGFGFEYRLSIQARDGRFKYTINNIIRRINPTSVSGGIVEDAPLEQMVIENRIVDWQNWTLNIFRELISSLKHSVTSTDNTW
ncbi:MAG: DUF4468 domain-containing protein [Bacteroidales bacterium]|nr:DUF4468 domain-containing protein [Bacteroidales bacterium]